MKKRRFLKMSSAALAGAALSQMNGCKQVDTSVAPPGSRAAARLKNWAGNLEYSTGNVVYPESVEQVQAFVMKADKIRALGSQHCFNKIADSPHQLLSTKNLNKVVALDPAKKTGSLGIVVGHPNILGSVNQNHPKEHSHVYSD